MCVCGGRGTRLGGVGKAVDTRPSFGNPSSHYTSGGPFFKKKNIKVLCSKSFFFLRVAIQFRYQREREFPGKNKSSGTYYWEIYKFQVFERVQGYCVFYSFYITTLWMFVCLFLTSIFSIPCLFDE
jgi:hypothetical protein